MMRLLAGLIASAVVLISASGCGIGDSGPRKIVVTESVCNGVDFLRMKRGQETKLIVDNTTHSERQNGLAIELREFPLRIIGELPPGAQVGPNFTTFAIKALPGEESSVVVKPTAVGQFTARCNISLAREGGGTGGLISQTTLTIQIVD